MKFKNRQNQSLVTEVRIMVLFKLVTAKEHSGDWNYPASWSMRGLRGCTPSKNSLGDKFIMYVLYVYNSYLNKHVLKSWLIMSFWLSVPFTKIWMVTQHWLTIYSIHSHSGKASGRSKGRSGSGFLPTSSWHVVLDLEQGSQLEGTTQGQSGSMPLRSQFPHTHAPKEPRPGLDSPLHQATGSVRRQPDARGQHGQGHFGMGIDEALVNRCPGHRDLSGSKTRMELAHGARVRPESAGRSIRKGHQAAPRWLNWWGVWLLLIGFSPPSGTTCQEAWAYSGDRRLDERCSTSPDGNQRYPVPAQGYTASQPPIQVKTPHILYAMGFFPPLQQYPKTPRSFLFPPSDALQPIYHVFSA